MRKIALARAAGDRATNYRLVVIGFWARIYCRPGRLHRCHGFLRCITIAKLFRAELFCVKAAPHGGVRKVTARFGEVIAITSYSGDCVENSMVNLNRETCHVKESHPHRCTVLRVGCWNGWRSYHPRAACFSKRTLHWIQLLIYYPNSGVLSPGLSTALVSITRKAARSRTAERPSSQLTLHAAIGQLAGRPPAAIGRRPIRGALSCCSCQLSPAADIRLKSTKAAVCHFQT